MDPSDFELLSNEADVDGSLHTFVDRHFVPIYRFTARRVGRDLGEQVAAEVFAVAFARRQTYVAVHDSARPWLYGIATNLLAQHRRDERRHLRAAARGEPSAPRTAEPFDDDATAKVDAMAAWPALSAALDRLSPKERDALLLSVWGGLSYAQVAEALDVPIGTVRSRINKARTKLQKELKPWNPSMS